MPFRFQKRIRLAKGVTLRDLARKLRSFRRHPIRQTKEVNPCETRHVPSEERLNEGFDDDSVMRRGRLRFVARMSELRDSRLVVRIDETELLLLRAGRMLMAIENRCPHAGATLTRAKVTRNTLRCGAHGTQFDLATGAAIGPVPGRDGAQSLRLRRYPVVVRGDDVFIEWPVAKRTVTEDCTASCISSDDN